MTTILDSLGDVTSRVAKLETYVEENPPATVTDQQIQDAVGPTFANYTTTADLTTELAAKADASAIAGLAPKTGPVSAPRTAGLRPALADAETLQHFTSSAELWLPANSTVAYPIGAEIPVDADSAAYGVLVTPDAGVTVVGTEDNRSRFTGPGVLKQLATDRWRMAGVRDAWEIVETFDVVSNAYAGAPGQTMVLGHDYGATSDWATHAAITGAGTAKLQGSQTGNAGLSTVGNGSGTSAWYMKRLPPQWNVRVGAEIKWVSAVNATFYMYLHLDAVELTYYVVKLSATTIELLRRSNTGGASTNAEVSLTSGPQTLTGDAIPAADAALKTLEVLAVDGTFTITWGGSALLGDITDDTPLAIGHAGMKMSSGTSLRVGTIWTEAIV